MNRQLELFDDLALYETVDVEFKGAKGGLPADLWETYSAFANTEGGTLWLGVSERSGKPEVHGLDNAPKVLADFWNTVNNRSKVSANLLKNADAELVTLPDCPRQLIKIRVRRAGRRERPVYIGADPLRGTFRRNFEGDYRCSEDEVRRMFADRAEEPADSRILSGFSMDDLHPDSLRQYRNRFASRAPNHPWLLEDDRGLLSKLGGWRVDRATGDSGLTLAGLLMFGREEAITAPEAVPGFQLDYRERLSSDPNIRWSDRLTLDGTWEGNLFQFYQAAMLKLPKGLPLPFQRDAEGYRKAETPVHEALQEALVNALIHADYAGQGGIVIDRYLDCYELSNPGSLLLSREQLLRGGISECRNKSLQRMFQMLGVGDKAGSGFDKIRSGWASQHWRSPHLLETVQPDRVRLMLPMVSMLPEEALRDLEVRFGESFHHLDREEIQALVTALVETEVTNQRLQEISLLHPAELTKLLQGLVRKGMLMPDGVGRGTKYRIAASVESEINSLHSGETSLHSEGSSLHSDRDSLHSGTELEFIGEPTADMMALAEPARLHRLPKAQLEQVLLSLCTGRFVTLAALAKAVDRNPESLRHRYLGEMVKRELLELRFPDRITHHQQAYRAKVATE